MAKTTDKRQEVPETPAPPRPQQPPPEAQVSTARIWVFWSGVALALIAARTLNYLLPGVSESVLERWVMLAFGAFVAVFLLKLK